MASQESDQKHLVQGIRALDPDMIDQLVEQYSSPLFLLILNYTKNASDAEEILQDTFLRVIKKIDTFREESSLWSWMKKIAVNNGLMWLRRHRARRERTIYLEEIMPASTEDGELIRPLHDWNVDPEDLYSRSELGDRLYAAIKALPSDYRVPLILKDIGGYSSKEIASMLSLKQPTTNTRIRRARCTLRKKLARYFEATSGEAANSRVAMN